MHKIATEDFKSTLPEGVNYPLTVNFVVSKDLKSKIFYDIFKRYMQFDPSLIKLEVSEEPVEGADIYHYHRPHLEDTLKAPAVVTVHHDPREMDPWVDANKFWRVYKQAVGIVCLNSLQQADLAHVGLEHTHVIPHGFDTTIFQRRKKTFDPDGKINIGYVSKRYGRRVKGDTYLFECLEILSPEHVRFTLVGEGRALDAARMRDMGYEVEVFENIPYRLFGSLYDNMDFLMMVSTYEGGPANLPEALASSTPVLASRVGMVPDLVRDGENGVILSGDIRRDAPVLRALMHNTDGITDHLFEGAHESDTVITWEDVIASHIQYYSEIMLKP